MKLAEIGHAGSQMSMFSPEHPRPVARNKVQEWAIGIVGSGWFNVLILVLILLNTVFLSMEYHGMPGAKSSACPSLLCLSTS